MVNIGVSSQNQQQHDLSSATPGWIDGRRRTLRGNAIVLRALARALTSYRATFALYRAPA